MDKLQTDSLQSALASLSRATGAELVFLGELFDSPMPRIRTICCIKDGEWAENFSYVLKDHPCQHTHDLGAFHVAIAARSDFPKAYLMHDHGMTSYAGKMVTLDGQTAKGIVVALRRTPFDDQLASQAALTALALKLSQQEEFLQRDIEVARATYATLVREAFFKEYVQNNQEGISFSEYMPPVPIDLPHEELLDRLIHTGYATECNRAMANLYGYTSTDAMLGATPLDVNGAIRAPVVIDFWIRKNYVLRDIESQSVDAEGKITWFLGSAVGEVQNGKVLHFWTKYRDITSQKRYEVAIEHKVHHDPLTGLPNRYWFQERIDAMLQDHCSRGKHFCLALLDLNGFKEVNDTLGHIIGDKLLQAVSVRLLHGLKKEHGAEIARLGGDEFAILLPEAGGQKNCEMMATTIQILLKAPFRIEEMNLQIGGAIGLTLSAGSVESNIDLLRHADIAMYAAKNQGRSYCWYLAEHDQHSRRRLILLTSLSQAVEQNQLFLEYQPKINLIDGKPSGFEALVRWNHPELGIIPPGDFIPYAETNEVIGSLTRWVIKESIRQGAAWRNAGLNMTMAINLSARNLADDSLNDFLDACLSAHDFPASLVELEITESALMTRPAHAMTMLHLLRQRGINIAIDDFGTGYSSLAYLARLPVSTLKIDQAFVKDMLHAQTNEQIVRTIIGLAHECRLKVVAEGVEEEAALTALRTMGCDLAQGYVIARPMPAEQATRWITEHQARPIGPTSMHQ